jgi:hypothetical protein
MDNLDLKCEGVHARSNHGHARHNERLRCDAGRRWQHHAEHHSSAMGASPELGV